MANVLVTGGTGFCGTWMQKTQPEGLSVRYIGRLEYVRYLLPYGYRHIVHLASISPTRVINYAKNSNARLLYCSSGAAYDQQTEYAENKRRWEQECKDSGVDCVVARLFTFFGDRLDDGKAYTQFMRAARAGLPLQVWGDGSTVRSYMHGRDLGRWLWAVLLRGESGETYDIGSDRPTTILQLAQRIARAGGCKIEMVDGDVPMPHYLPRDTAKTRLLLEKGGKK